MLLLSLLLADFELPLLLTSIATSTRAQLIEAHPPRLARVLVHLPQKRSGPGRAIRRNSPRPKRLGRHREAGVTRPSEHLARGPYGGSCKPHGCPRHRALRSGEPRRGFLRRPRLRKEVSGETARAVLLPLCLPGDR